MRYVLIFIGLLLCASCSTYKADIPAGVIPATINYSFLSKEAGNSVLDFDVTARIAIINGKENPHSRYGMNDEVLQLLPGKTALLISFIAAGQRHINFSVPLEFTAASGERYELVLIRDLFNGHSTGRYYVGVKNAKGVFVAGKNFGMLPQIPKKKSLF